MCVTTLLCGQWADLYCKRSSLSICTCIVCIERENRLQYNPLNGHKSAHGLHRRDLTHTFCKVAELFFIEILSFS